MIVLNEKERARILEVCALLKTWTGHDSNANIDYRYGKEWWVPVDALRKDIEKILKG